MNKQVALWMTLVGLAGCAGEMGELPADPGAQTPRLDEVSMNDAPVVPVVEPLAPREVDLSVSVVDADGTSVGASACRLFSRRPGDHTHMRSDLPFGATCAFDAGGVTTLPVHEKSEVALAMAAPGYPNAIVHVTTGSEALDLSGRPLRMLDDERLAAIHRTAGIASTRATSTVVVETSAAGATYEILLYTTDAGPAALYLDAEGKLLEGAEASVAGGFAVFTEIPLGMHAVAFGHSTSACSQSSELGWAGWEQGTTTVWTSPGYVTTVSGIGCND